MSCWFHEPHKGVHVFNVMFRHQQEQTISFLCLVGLNETSLVDWTCFDFCNTHVYILHSQFRYGCMPHPYTKLLGLIHVIY
jgi:hypothetical protein